jgi:hypothetical protein
MLHVTNGDFAAQRLLRSGLSGDVLPWRDVLHDGPVPPDRDRAAFCQTRSRFLAENGWTSAESANREFLARDARLDAPTRDDAVILWFEPDLYDQLQLIQVLARLHQREVAQRPEVCIVPADVMLGPLAPEQFAPLFHGRRGIGADDLARGRMVWEAFTAETPDALDALIGRFDREMASRSYASDPEARLPHLTAALRRMLEEYPGVESGLSRSERQILQTLTDGPMTMRDLYQASHGPHEAWAWLGDWSFASYVQRLSKAAVPLVSREDGEPIGVPTPGHDAQRVWEQLVAITAAGNDVLQERADAIATNGIDRWIGGVHLVSSRHWRWNRHAQHLERAGRDS